MLIFLSIYMFFGIATLIFYLIDFRDVKADVVSKVCVCLIALFLFPLFWIIRQIVLGDIKL